MNNDIEIISRGWIKAMLEHCQKDSIAAVGAKLLYQDDTLQHAGVFLTSEGLCLHSHKHLPEKNTGYYLRPHIVHNVSAVTGACLMIKKKHFYEVGGFDEDNLKITYNDVDLCLKLHEKGYWNIYTPFAKLYHYESVSRGFETTPKLQAELDFFEEKWRKTFNHDPFYNHNLVQNDEDYSLRF